MQNRSFFLPSNTRRIFCDAISRGEKRTWNTTRRQMLSTHSASSLVHMWREKKKQIGNRLPGKQPEASCAKFKVPDSNRCRCIVVSSSSRHCCISTGGRKKNLSTLVQYFCTGSRFASTCTCIIHQTSTHHTARYFHCSLWFMRKQRNFDGLHTSQLEWWCQLF